ncbi:MAG TPA: 3-dehydroquinate synthase [Mycobacteriales bacterium]|nr:3-dehydroquinate synthase [Mycobacteriales bacterium]
MSTVVPVGGATPYDVVVGHGLASELPALVSGATTVAIVVDPTVRDRIAGLVAALHAAGHRVERLDIAAGEAAKSVASVETLWVELAALRMTRSDALVAVGGGATTDAAGFAAATWLRGIRVVHVPTTLLGMVDAAIGGKTAINIAAGKNLVGAFHAPAGVLVDLDLLATLPDAQWVNGMAEVVKTGFIADPAILDLIDRDPAAATSPRGPSARELVERSIVVKAAVVSKDLRESGPREFLNYGHTLGHAIEQVEGFRIPHGHAVSIGLVFAAALGRLSGRLDEATATRHATVLRALGLPVSYRPDALAELTAAMRIDKKARGDHQRFVVLDGLGSPGILEDPEPALVAAAYSEVAA